MSITVSDLPLSCPFLVITTDDTILHVFDGTGYGDISPLVAMRTIVDVSTRNGFIVVTVE